MIYFYVLTAIVAALNGIGMRHAVPLTGINPSSSFIARTFSSLEIAASIHGLRSLQPIVFSTPVATIEDEFLLQHTLNLKMYKDAKMALEKSSLDLGHLPRPRNITSPSGNMSHWNQADEGLWDWETPTSQPDTSHWALCFVAIVAMIAMQAFISMWTFDLKCRQGTIEGDLDEIRYYHQDQHESFEEMAEVFEGMGDEFLSLTMWQSDAGRKFQALSVESYENAQRMEGIVNQAMDAVQKVMSGIKDRLDSISGEQKCILETLERKLETVRIQSRNCEKYTERLPGIVDNVIDLNRVLSQDPLTGNTILHLSDDLMQSAGFKSGQKGASDDVLSRPESPKRSAFTPSLRDRLPINASPPPTSDKAAARDTSARKVNVPDTTPKATMPASKRADQVKEPIAASPSNSTASSHKVAMSPFKRAEEKAAEPQVKTPGNSTAPTTPPKTSFPSYKRTEEKAGEPQVKSPSYSAAPTTPPKTSFPSSKRAEEKVGDSRAKTPSYSAVPVTPPKRAGATAGTPSTTPNPSRKPVPSPKHGAAEAGQPPAAIPRKPSVPKTPQQTKSSSSAPAEPEAREPLNWHNARAPPE
ncbi:unnamed protein product [Penicillium olsonii]|nr:unnamed protein product [Penicillium olsonii]